MDEYKPEHYECKAQRHKKEIVEKRDFSVIKTQLQNQIVNVGHPFETKCTSFDVSSNKIQWYKDGIEISREMMKLENNNYLYIPRVVFENGGKYECIAKGNSFEVYSEILLYVKGPGNINSYLLF